jgi:hypothetical protein
MSGNLKAQVELPIALWVDIVGLIRDIYCREVMFLFLL